MIKYICKLSLLTNIFFICVLICFKSYAENITSNNTLVMLGEDNAPVKIKIFSSLTCPHCASFHMEVVPKIKKKYIDSGKVQLIFIDFPLDQAAFNASKLLHCLDNKKKIAYLNIIYGNQKKWASGSDLEEINKKLKKIVKSLGISSDKFNKCLNDEVIGNKILTNRIDGQRKYSINSTPTIIINEKKLEDSVSFKNISKKIEKLI